MLLFISLLASFHEDKHVYCQLLQEASLWILHLQVVRQADVVYRCLHRKLRYSWTIVKGKSESCPGLLVFFPLIVTDKCLLKVSQLLPVLRETKWPLSSFLLPFLFSFLFALFPHSLPPAQWLLLFRWVWKVDRDLQFDFCSWTPRIRVKKEGELERNHSWFGNKKIKKSLFLFTCQWHSSVSYLRQVKWILLSNFMWKLFSTSSGLTVMTAHVSENLHIFSFKFL